VKDLSNIRNKWILKCNKSKYIVVPAVKFHVFLCVLMYLAVMNQVRNLGLGGKTCLDSPARKADLHKPAGLYPCHNQGGNQVRNFCPRVAAVAAAEHTSDHHSCCFSCANI
jgi:hypothetical protein